MAYLPERFPLLIAEGPQGGPTFSTDVVTLVGGEEQRNQNWSESRHEYEFSHGIKNSAQFARIGAHFRQARGKANKFRVKDWGDFEATQDEGGALAIEGSTTTFQMCKNYGTNVGFIEQRKITRPVAGFSLWISSVLQTLGGSYTVDIETGIVTIAGAPDPADIAWAGEFDVPCRYDTDKLVSVLVSYRTGGSYHSWTSVPVVEVREPEDE